MTTITGIMGLFAIILGLMGWEIISLRKQRLILENIKIQLEDDLEISDNQLNNAIDDYNELINRTPMKKFTDTLTEIGISYEVKDYDSNKAVKITDRKKPVVFTFEADGSYAA